MSLTRAQAAIEISAQYGDAMLAVGKPATDTSGSLKEPIDLALRAIGVAQGSEVTATIAGADVDRFLVIGGYFVIRRALAAAMGMADVAATTLGVSKRKSQIADNLRKQLDEARRDAVAFGFGGVVGMSMTSGVYLLDTIEPEDLTA